MGHRRKENYYDKSRRLVGETYQMFRFLLRCLGVKVWRYPIPHSHDGAIAVFVNGPSLKEALAHIDDWQEFRHVDFAVVNFFAFDPLFAKIKPRHYCTVDPGFFDKAYLSFAQAAQTYEILENEVDWPLNLYIPSTRVRAFYNIHRIKNKNITVFPVNLLAYKGIESLRHYFYRRGYAMPQAENVSSVIAFIAVNLGYRHINLYGADFSFFDSLCVDDNNIVCCKIAHFYDEKPKLEPMSYSLPGEYFTMSGLLTSHAISFKSHEQLRDYADSRGVRIVNCSRHSLIDAYERKYGGEGKPNPALANREGRT